MITGHSEPELRILLDLIEQSYRLKAWHGPNLKGSIRGLTADEAAWRPAPNRHNIAEHVLHAAYWKYMVRRRILAEPRSSFGLKGSNWFPVSDALAEADWRAYVRVLEREHAALRQAIAGLRPDEIHETPPASKVSNLAQILGIASHDVYHAGQIQLLKRLQRGS